MKTVPVAGLSVGNDQPLTVIAGPCALESGDHAQMIAGAMKDACAESVGENSVHGSDAPETAAVEIAYFFSGIEMVG